MNRQAALWILGSTLSAIAVSVGCGGNVRLEPGGAGGDGGQGGVTTTTTTGPGSTTSTGTGGAAQCGQTLEGFSLDLQREDGTVWGCGYGPATQQGELSFNAEILDGWEGGYVLNTCAPDANCLPTKEVLVLHAPGLPMSIPTGAFIEVTVSVYQPWGCEHHVLIKNLPQWGGLANPHFGDDRLFLAAGDGNPFPVQGAPFWVETVALGCYPDAPPGCTTKEDFALRFFQVDQEGNSITVPMGVTSEWKILIPDGKFPLVVRNLRSFETGNCDDYWNWGYYAASPGDD
jgi:hypothetical protein